MYKSVHISVGISADEIPAGKNIIIMQFSEVYLNVQDSCNYT